MLTSVESVTGAVPIDDLGVIMPHEHLFLDTMREYRGDGLVHDQRLVESEVARYAEAGGRTLVDCTTRGLQPDPARVRQVAQATDVVVVMGTGFYRHPFLDENWFDRHSVDEVADLLIRDISVGIDDTGVRAGIIGEIGCERYITPAEERSFRAAARAHHATGLTITTHAARWPVGLPQLDLLVSEGVDPGRVIIGHCDMVPNTAYHFALAERGVFVQFDNIQGGPDYARHRTIDAIKRLVDAGYSDRVLLSQDICLVSQFAAMGGVGYGYILRTFLTELASAGVDRSALDHMVTTNPARALTGQP